MRHRHLLIGLGALCVAMPRMATAQAIVQDNTANIERAKGLVATVVNMLGVSKFYQAMQVRTDLMIQQTNLMTKQREKSEAAAVGEGGQMGGVVRDTRTDDMVAEGDTSLRVDAGVVAGTVDALCLRQDPASCEKIRVTAQRYETGVDNLVTKYRISTLGLLGVRVGQSGNEAAVALQAKTGIDSGGRSGQSYKTLVQAALDATALDSLARGTSNSLDALAKRELSGEMSSGRAVLLSLVQHYGVLKLTAAGARTEIDKLSISTRGARTNVADFRQREVNTMRSVDR